MDDLFIGNAKENEFGMSLELNLTKLNRLLESPSIVLALKTFAAHGGSEQTAIMLHITRLPIDQQNKYRTHSVSINDGYRQKKS